MALLKQSRSGVDTARMRGALAVGIMVLLAPELAAAQRRIQLRLYDQRVECRTGRCEDPSTRLEAEGESFSVPLQLTELTPGEGGLRLRFTLDSQQRSSSAAVGILIPKDGRSPQVTYQEVNQGQVTFTADATFGLIEVSAHLLGLPGEACLCDGGRLELTLRDDGPDGTPLTGDDAHRQIMMGAFSNGEGDYCRSPELLAADWSSLSVVPLTWCPRPHREPPPDGDLENDDAYYDDPYYDDPYYDEISAGCLVEDPDPYYDDGGCGGEEPDWETEDSWEEGGCEGDGAAETDYGEGCEGSYEDSESMDCEGGSGGGDYGGCEGDSGGADCEGDAYAAVRNPGRGHPRARPRAHPLFRQLGALSPFIIFGLFVTLSRRLRRRRR